MISVKLLVSGKRMTDESVEIMFLIPQTSNATMATLVITMAVPTQGVILKHRRVRSMLLLARSTLVRPTPIRSP